MMVKHPVFRVHLLNYIAFINFFITFFT